MIGTILRLALLAPLLLGTAACVHTSNPVTRSVAETKAVMQKTSAVVSISGPYDAAKQCTAKVRGVSTIRVGVGHIADNTGKVNTTDEGTGTFISQGVSDFFISSLSHIGVKLIALSPDYRGTVDWLGAKGVKGAVAQPQFMVAGSVTSLDFQPGGVAEFSIAGFGPKSRAHKAIGSMDVQLITMPYGKTLGGLVVTTSSPAKEFIAAVNEMGFGSFLSLDPIGTTFASFRVGTSVREPMQHTMRFMADYAAVDLILNMIEQLSADGSIPDQRSAIKKCRELLENPFEQKVQVAQAG